MEGIDLFSMLYHSNRFCSMTPYRKRNCPITQRFPVSVKTSIFPEVLRCWFASVSRLAAAADG
jgi:hypothetical protein